ncbi:MAG: protein translocase subunit SecF [Candidatus Aminicenantes bacterium]|nr:protein translocase subunit SecF [Candidatus Aminicenantes bacterium]
MQFFKTPRIPFLKYKWFALGLTVLIVGAGLVNIIAFRGLKPGVDFGGGTLLRVKYKSATEIGEIRRILQDQGLGNAVIQETGEKDGREYQVRTAQAVAAAAGEQEMDAHEKLADQVIEALRTAAGPAAPTPGTSDLNAMDAKTLASLLAVAYPERAEDLAQKIIAFRNQTGIFADFDEIAAAGVGDDVVRYLASRTSLGSLTVLSRETVGPQVGKDLRGKAIQATIWALLGMLVYIALRFKLAYGVAAIFTLFQDVLITMSIYSFTNREVNLPIIAGILTIVGFSINDTIVIFDRVRENQKIMRREPLEAVMNASLNQTLGRTIITSGTLLLTLLALYFFGGEVINDFAFIMLVGTVEGIYSTVFMSCPIVLVWYKLFAPRKAAKK